MTAPERDALQYPGRLDGLDISSVQVVHDFAAVAAAGFRWVTCKASEGVYYCDPRLLGFLDGFRKVGLHVQVYGFARPSQGKPREQARRLFACAGDIFPTRPAIDLESGPDDWTPDQYIAFAEEYADECMQIGWLPPELYSFPWFVKSKLQPALARSSVLTACPYWSAHYQSTTSPWVPPPNFQPYVPVGFATWTKHQYSGNGGYRVRGIYGDVDRNLFNGDEAAFQRYLGLPEETPREPEPMAIIHKIPETTSDQDE